MYILSARCNSWSLLMEIHSIVWRPHGYKVPSKHNRRFFQVLYIIKFNIEYNFNEEAFCLFSNVHGKSKCLVQTSNGKKIWVLIQLIVKLNWTKTHVSFCFYYLPTNNPITMYWTSIYASTYIVCTYYPT